MGSSCCSLSPSARGGSQIECRSPCPGLLCRTQTTEGRGGEGRGGEGRGGEGRGGEGRGGEGRGGERRDGREGKGGREGGRLVSPWALIQNPHY